MVDFRLNDETKALQELAHDFAEREMRPEAWELGLMNIHTPERYGGLALSSFDGVVLQEELAWGCSGIQTSLGANGLAAAPVDLGESEEVKREYFGELVESPKLASFCL